MLLKAFARLPPEEKEAPDRSLDLSGGLPCENDSGGRILLALLDQTMTVGMEELLELFDLILKDEALVSVSDKYAVCGVGLDNRGAGDVLHVLNGFAGRAEGLVLDQMKAL